MRIDEITNNLPAMLYHGTGGADNIELILKHGLDPRASASSQKVIYLADHSSIAAEYANARDDYKTGWAVFEINTRNLDVNLLGPDDYELQDIIDDIKRNPTRAVATYGEKANLLANYVSWKQVPWQLSLQMCQQVTYAGFIPTSELHLVKRQITEITNPYSVPPRWINAKFATHCSSCGRDIFRGEKVSWSPLTKKVTCPECVRRAEEQAARQVRGASRN